LKIECSSCNKIYDIPDERLPEKKTFSFPCPECKGIISVDLAGKGEDKQTRETADTPEKALPKGEALKKQILRKVTQLPAMPQTVLKARQIMSQEGSSFDELAEVLKTDQAIASKLLKLSNSAYYGMRGKVSSLQHASVVLGLNTLKEIIVMAGASSLLASDLPGYGLASGDLWQHSLGAAFGAKMIAERKAPELAEDAFVAGLIHDCGKLVLDEAILERSEMFASFMEAGDQSFLIAEKNILGFDHSEMAFALCGQWGVPETINTAIRYPHKPTLSRDDKMTCIVHLADALAMMSGMGTGVDGLAYEMDDKAMAMLNIEENDIPEIMEQMVEAVMNVAGPES
jgi:HD-like signal output (HDOD) protein